MNKYDLFIIILVLNLFMYDFTYLANIILISYISMYVFDFLDIKIKEYKELKEKVKMLENK